MRELARRTREVGAVLIYDEIQVSSQGWLMESV